MYRYRTGSGKYAVRRHWQTGSHDAVVSRQHQDCISVAGARDGAGRKRSAPFYCPILYWFGPHRKSICHFPRRRLSHDHSRHPVQAGALSTPVDLQIGSGYNQQAGWPAAFYLVHTAAHSIIARKGIWTASLQPGIPTATSAPQQT